MGREANEFVAFCKHPAPGISSWRVSVKSAGAMAGYFLSAGLSAEPFCAITRHNFTCHSTNPNPNSVVADPPGTFNDAWDVTNDPAPRIPKRSLH